MKKSLFLFFSLLKILEASSQHLPVIPCEESTHLIDRFGVLLNKDSSFHTQVKPFGQEEILDILERQKDELNQNDYRFLYQEISEDSDFENSTNQKPFLKYFYKNKNNFFNRKIISENKTVFDFTVNPVLNINLGKADYKTNLIVGSDTIYQNTRGVEVLGRLGKNISFYTYFADNQTKVPLFARQKFITQGAVLGEGQWVGFKRTGFDYYSARAYLGFKLNKFMNLDLGHGRHFIGDGYRSLILSNMANDYPYMKLRTKVWRLQYTNLYAQLTDFIINKGDGEGAYPSKYFMMHHLSINITNHIQLGVFESVLNGLPDSLNGGFQVSYMNPIIFYRSAERNLGSPHNNNLGLDLKINFMKHLQVYGQIVLDDYNFGERKNGEGWWGNKYSIQSGVKYYDFLGLKNLDLLFEMNQVQPYTYTHWYKGQNYSHFGQALAHPLGANFREFVYKLDYTVFEKLSMHFLIFNISQGIDNDSLEWGSNIYGSGNPARLYGNKLLQGELSKISLFDGRLTYRLMHKIYVDFIYTRRSWQVQNVTQNENIFQLGFRMHSNARKLTF